MNSYLTIENNEQTKLLDEVSISSSKSNNKKIIYVVAIILFTLSLIHFYPRNNPFDKLRKIKSPTPSKYSDYELFKFEGEKEINLEHPDLCPKMKYSIIKMIDLYELHPTENHYKIYEDNAKFEDPLCDARSVLEIKTQFNGMLKIFNQAKIVRANIISVAEIVNSTSSVYNPQVQMELWQLYRMGKSNIPMKSLVILDFDGESKKIKRHLDLWNYEASWYNQNFIIGFFWNLLRRANGKLLPYFM